MLRSIVTYTTVYYCILRIINSISVYLLHHPVIHWKHLPKNILCFSCWDGRSWMYISASVCLVYRAPIIKGLQPTIQSTWHRLLFHLGHLSADSWCFCRLGFTCHCGATAMCDVIRCWGCRHRQAVYCVKTIVGKPCGHECILPSKVKMKPMSR